LAVPCSTEVKAPGTSLQVSIPVALVSPQATEVVPSVVIS